MPSYRLISVGGDDLGRLNASAPYWSPGDRIQHGSAGELVVVRFVAAEPGDEVEGYLIVERDPGRDR